MLDIQGTTLDDEDRALLQNPQVGGLILFTRNYESPQQLINLVREVRENSPEILIAVDQEGGRVQRFRECFTRLPPMRAFGLWANASTPEALDAAQSVGWLMAAELLTFGIDISFAPVLDLEYGVSEVIGDRSFSDSPEQLILLAKAWIKGMNSAGMSATGKHFPGHGAVALDSHTDIPHDERPFQEISKADIKPFKDLSAQYLGGIMPAHVIYPEIDANPAGFSEYWLQNILRNSLGFNGVIFSDDLSMAGASVVGGFTQRAQAALGAGCDMILVCNNRSGAKEVIEAMHLGQLSIPEPATSLLRIKKMRARPETEMTFEQLKQSAQWRSARQNAEKAWEWIS